MKPSIADIVAQWNAVDSFTNFAIEKYGGEKAYLAAADNANSNVIAEIVIENYIQQFPSPDVITTIYPRVRSYVLEESFTAKEKEFSGKLRHLMDTISLPDCVIASHSSVVQIVGEKRSAFIISVRSSITAPKHLVFFCK